MELILWVLIFFGIASGIMFAKNKLRKDFETYQIFLPDVDGLIVGSPVRLMGIHVGYISQLNIVGEDVYVKFVVTKPNVKLPPESRATVEFSGLGGSKSLEIYPPTKKSQHSDKLIIAEPPKRIHDALGLLGNMFDKVISISSDISEFSSEIGGIKKENAGKSKEIFKQMTPESFMNYTNMWIDNGEQRTNDLNKFVDNVNKKNAKLEKIGVNSNGTNGHK